MKKVTKILGLACMAGVLAFTTSCKKNQDSNQTSSIEVAVADDFMTDGGERAYIESSGQIFWNADDQIVVYNLDDQYDESKRSVFHNVTGTGPRARFQGPTVGPKKTFGYRFFFPTEMIDWTIGDGDGDLANCNREHFVVSHTQNYGRYTDGGHQSTIMDPDAMPMAVDPVNLTNSVNLKHIFGVANVQVKADDGEDVYVKQVELFDQGYNLWGTCSLCLHNVRIADLNQLWYKYYNGDDEGFATQFASYVMAAPDAGGLGWDPNGQGNSIVMNCIHKDDNNNDVYVKLENDPDANKTTNFMFLVRPLACSKGMVVKVTLEDDSVYTMTDFAEEVLNYEDWGGGIMPIGTRGYTIRPGFIKNFDFLTLHEGHVRPYIPQMDVNLNIH